MQKSKEGVKIFTRTQLLVLSGVRACIYYTIVKYSVLHLEKKCQTLLS